MASTTPPPRSCCVRAALQQVRNLYARTPPSSDYPPISSIPPTSPERISAASSKEPLETPLLFSSSPLAAPYLATDTVLYLAYGSNLAAETFLGVRGIRPLSATNVSVPTLCLTFDLAGIAYKEPCFANVAPRKLPKPPKLPPGFPDPPEIPHPPPGYTVPPVNAAAAQDAPARLMATAYGDRGWDKGLVGVVYEVTAADYATILRTEGGGAAYKDIMVPCLEIPTRPPGIPEKPSPPEVPRPFWAHTLYAPIIPTRPGDGDGNGDEENAAFGGGDGDDGGCEDPIDRLKAWWRNMLLSPIRTDPDYAQPSARYLKLIVDGAAEHELPMEYQRWLRSLQPYTITSRLQAVGQLLFLAFVAPITLVMIIGNMLADKNGQMPIWITLLMETIFHLAWMTYDRLFKPVFGDGERTEDTDDSVRSGRSWGLP